MKWIYILLKIVLYLMAAAAVVFLIHEFAELLTRLIMGMRS